MGCYNKSTVSFFVHSGMSQTEKSQGDNVMLCKVCNEKPSKFLLVVALNPDILVLNVASITVVWFATRITKCVAYCLFHVGCLHRNKRRRKCKEERSKSERE